MDAIGMREWVGLAGLAIAVLVALSFCNPAVGTETEPRPITLGEPVTPTAVPSSPTPTAVPPTDLGAPENWFVQYFTGPNPADGVEDSRGFVDTLDVEHEVAPYPGLRDDDWSLVASARWRELPAGRYAFTLESDGAVRVIANGKEVRSEPDAEGARDLRIVVDHEGGTLDLAIAAVDTGGPFLLRWR